MKKLIATVVFAILSIGTIFMPAYGFIARPDREQQDNSQTHWWFRKCRLSDSPAKLIEVFGTPANTSNAFAEMHDTTINRYDYKGMEAYFEGSRLFSLKIKEDVVSLYLDGKTAIKTGDHISTIGTLFPNSYALKKDGQMMVGIKLADGTATDEVLNFRYDGNGVITDIVI